MKDGVPRRTFLGWTGGVGIGNEITRLTSNLTTSESSQRQSTIAGTVLDVQNNPVTGAAIEVVRSGNGQQGTVETDESGRFTVDADGPCWLRGSHPNYATTVQAAVPGNEALLRLPPENSISLRFGGDVMFGRRFYGENPDPLSPRFRIDSDDLLADHRAILDYTKPLLDGADITSVNLETPLTTTGWRHPNKGYTFSSHPVAARALSEAGVNYVSLANNHILDALEPGLTETIETLDEAGIAHSGAGRSSEAAWNPAIADDSGMTIAFISCTTITGSQYAIDWSADRGGSNRHTVRQNGEKLTFPGSVGAAEANEERLEAQIKQARSEADFVVVQIHGGEQYQRSPTDAMRSLVETAGSAGADLIVNHHPHVTGGLEYVNGALVAWSLGNFVFDQELWATLRSYLFTAHVTENGVVSATIDPLLLDGYVPKGVTGTPHQKIQWGTAGRSGGRFALTARGLEQLPRQSASDVRVLTTETISESGTIYTRQSGWIQDIEDGENAVMLGRERILSGGFDNDIVDAHGYTAPLWRFGRGEGTTGPGIGRSSGGIRLTRRADNVDRALLSPRSRIPIDGREFTFSGSYRFDGDAGLEVLVSWYGDTSGGSFSRDAVSLRGTDGEWKQVQWTLDAPEDAEYVDVFVRLAPPDRGTHEASFDDLRLIEWATDSHGGRSYDHLSLDGTATMSFAVPEGERARWRELPGDSIN